MACVYRGHSVPMVVLPPALICPLVPKHCHPSIASSSAFTFALWLSLIFPLPSFHLCHCHSLLIGPFLSLFIYYFLFYFFICFTFSCFISFSVSLCPQQASVSVSPSSSSPLYFYFFKTPTQSLFSQPSFSLSL